MFTVAILERYKLLFDCRITLEAILFEILDLRQLVLRFMLLYLQDSKIFHHYHKFDQLSNYCERDKRYESKEQQCKM